MKEFGKDGDLKSVSSSAFGVVKDILNGALIAESEEGKQKEEMQKSLGNLFRVKKDSIAGAKKSDVYRIVESVFGIHEVGGASSKGVIKKFTLQEILLYFCYVERLIKVTTSAKSTILSEIKRSEEVQKNLEEKRAKIEKIRKEQEEKDRLYKMSNEEFIEYEISCGKDIEYYNKLEEKGKEKELIAQKLKEYWISQNKWTGCKISKKQINKIRVVKKILGEGDLL